ncbi:hypothetical protein IZ6_04870 [Terrihabitans soli]|uniref:DUF2066 domain-containing protein n=1 Tax=Terrihabitans soli TaxID=708113 RepID=A0A6S6QR55_9HYPH|nr:DUF2066 domain-containing protein [Terrihabitans soli]BCJ89752.1 hypothetical protein IZ6_04870 [Terrihabitans soli]
MRRFLISAVPAVFVLASVCSGGAQAEPVVDLYRAQVFVTGERPETRDPALLQGYRDVMVKVSGDPRLLADPKLDAGFDPAVVHTFSYRDLMAGIPKHDEQGTRDRPFEITIDYAPERIDAALAELGQKPWGDERPKILFLIGVELGPSHFILTDQGEPGSVQRTALIASARRYGLPLILPSRAMIEASGLAADGLKTPVPAALETLMREAGAERVLAGHILFSDRMLGWIARWQTSDDGAVYRWGIEGVNFDEAFRNAVRGTAQALSGHGTP